MKRLRKQQKVIIMLVASGVLLLGMALLAGPFRGWARASLLPSFTQVFYGTNNARIFDNEFNLINKQLAEYGLSFVDKSMPANPRDPSNGCVVSGYDSVSESIYCQKIASYKPQSLSDAMSRWPEQSPKLVQFLEDRGWRKTFDDQPSYTELFSPPEGNGNWLTYYKNRGKVHCTFMIAYNPPYPNPDDQMWIHQRCVRMVEYFGGY